MILVPSETPCPGRQGGLSSFWQREAVAKEQTDEEEGVRRDKVSGERWRGEEDGRSDRRRDERSDSGMDA